MAYFDNAATTFPKPECVYKGIDDFNRNLAMNINRGKYEKSIKAGQIVHETRNMLLKLLNADGTHKVIFTPSATISLNMILQGLDYKQIKNVYITPFEHNAVLRPLNYLRDLYNFKIIELCVKKDNIEYDLEGIKYQFQDQKPDLVIATHVSNVCGIIAPIKEIFDESKKYKAVTVSDMSQSCGLIDVNLKETQADFIVFAGHKTLYSMLGIGGFFIKNGLDLKPVLYGGTGVQSALEKQPESLPEKFEVGSSNTPAIASLYYSLNWLLSQKNGQVYEKEKINFERLHHLLLKYKNITLHGVSKNSSGIISCTFSNLSPDNVGNILAEKGIAVRTGLHCSPNAHKFLGTFPAGTVRFSVNYFTSDEDFIELANALDYIEENS